MKRIFFSIFTILFSIYLLDNWLTEKICQNILYKNINSPSLEYKVVIFERSCGATTEISTHVSIMRTEDGLPNTGGNIFISEAESNKVKLNWLSAKHVEISFPENTRTFKKEEKWKDIKISYDLI